MCTRRMSIKCSSSGSNSNICCNSMRGNIGEHISTAAHLNSNELVWPHKRFASNNTDSCSNSSSSSTTANSNSSGISTSSSNNSSSNNADCSLNGMIGDTPRSISGSRFKLSFKKKPTDSNESSGISSSNTNSGGLSGSLRKAFCEAKHSSDDRDNNKPEELLSIGSGGEMEIKAREEIRICEDGTAIQLWKGLPVIPCKNRLDAGKEDTSTTPFVQLNTLSINQKSIAKVKPEFNLEDNANTSTNLVVSQVPEVPSSITNSTGNSIGYDCRTKVEQEKMAALEIMKTAVSSSNEPILVRAKQLKWKMLLSNSSSSSNSSSHTITSNNSSLSSKDNGKTYEKNICKSNSVMEPIHRNYSANTNKKGRGFSVSSSSNSQHHKETAVIRSEIKYYPEASQDSYHRISVEDFGLAMMLGMGYNPETKLHDANTSDVQYNGSGKVRKYVRPYLLKKRIYERAGLGADEKFLLPTEKHGIVGTGNTTTDRT